MGGECVFPGARPIDGEASDSRVFPPEPGRRKLLAFAQAVWLLRWAPAGTDDASGATAKTATALTATAARP